MKPLWVDKIKDAVPSCITKTEVLRKLGINIHSGNFQTLDRWIKILDIDISHFNSLEYTHKLNEKSSGVFDKNNKYDINKIFSENSIIARKTIKKYYKLVSDYKCKCGNDGNWEGVGLILQLDHINGNNSDNRLENLRWLCPNCHSQTETYCIGHNRKIQTEKTKEQSRQRIMQSWIDSRKVKNRPSKEELQELISQNSWVDIGKQYGVSDNAIKKWARGYSIKIPVRRRTDRQ